MCVTGAGGVEALQISEGIQKPWDIKWSPGRPPRSSEEYNKGTETHSPHPTVSGVSFQHSFYHRVGAQEIFVNACLILTNEFLLFLYSLIYFRKDVRAAP